jgi:hypothetical protein
MTTPQRDTPHGKEVSGEREELAMRLYGYVPRKNSSAWQQVDRVQQLLDQTRTDIIEAVKGLPDMQPVEPTGATDVAINIQNQLRQQLTTTLDGLKEKH